MIISETFEGSATDMDVMKAPSRLQAVPFVGKMTLEISATQCDASNYVEMTLQPPDGETITEDAKVPANGYETGDSVLHNDTETIYQLDVLEQGHVILSMVVTGSVRWIVRATLTEA